MGEILEIFCRDGHGPFSYPEYSSDVLPFVFLSLFPPAFSPSSLLSSLLPLCRGQREKRKRSNLDAQISDVILSPWGGLYCLPPSPRLPLPLFYSLNLLFSLIDDALKGTSRGQGRRETGERERLRERTCHFFSVHTLTNRGMTAVMCVCWTETEKAKGRDFLVCLFERVSMCVCVYVHTCVCICTQFISLLQMHIN